MSTVRVAESGTIPAAPEVVYAILADYRNEHPHVLPKRYFKALVVEEGGRGAGTVFTATTRALGVTSSLHMVVSEPEPGRVLVETDLEQGVVTTFTVIPSADGQGTNLCIATDWTLHDGLRGSIERVLYPLAARPMYRAELRQFAEYVQRGDHTVPSRDDHAMRPVSSKASEGSH